MDTGHVAEKFAQFSEPWRSKVVAGVNGQEVKLVKVQGVFPCVPRGVEHRTAAEEEAEVLIFEPADVLNTGNMQDETFTAPVGARL